jgi:hypothetical protein
MEDLGCGIVFIIVGLVILLFIFDVFRGIIGWEVLGGIVGGALIIFGLFCVRDGLKG